jgi:iron complex outermembrane receptor protein
LQASVAYFDITQSSFGVPNPGNLVVPAPNPPLPLLFSDRKATGWEFAATYEPVKGVTLIANYADFTNRDVNDVPFRSTPERSAAAWLRYEFPTGSLQNLSFSIGANYLDKRPGDAASGYTAASTPTSLIPNQPSFWLPARTVVDLAAAYKFKTWHLQANVDNVFDKEYMAASLTRYLVTAGPGINLRVSAAYKF